MIIIGKLHFLKEKMIIQFNATRIEDGEKPSEILATQLIRWGKIMDCLYMAPYVKGKGSAGNIGFRDSNGMIYVTSSGGCLGNLSFDNIMAIERVEEENPPRVYFYGHKEKKPTSESLIYWDIFQSRKDISVVLHGHDLLSLEKAEHLQEAHPEFVSITASVTNAGSPEFRREINKILNRNNHYLIGKEHGFFALGKTFDEAGFLSLELRTEATNLFLREEMNRLKNKYDVV